MAPGVEIAQIVGSLHAAWCWGRRRKRCGVAVEVGSVSPKALDRQLQLPAIEPRDAIMLNQSNFSACVFRKMPNARADKQQALIHTRQRTSCVGCYAEPQQFC